MTTFRPTRRAALLGLASAPLALAAASAQSTPPLDVPYVPTPQEVVDRMLRRILVVSADGRIAAAALGIPTGGVPGGLAAARGTDRHGRFYFEGNAFDQERGTFIDSVAVVRWNPADGRSDVITRVSTGGRVILNLPGGAASLARSITPFPHLDAWTVLPDGQVAVVHHDPFRIDIVDAAGGVQRGTVIAFTPLAVSAGSSLPQAAVIATAESTATEAATFLKVRMAGSSLR